MPGPTDLLRQLSERGRPRGAAEVFAAASARPVIAPRVLVAAAVVLTVVTTAVVVNAGDGAGSSRGLERAEIAQAPRDTPSTVAPGSSAPTTGDDGVSDGPSDDGVIAPLGDGDAVTTRLESHSSCESVLDRLRELGSAAVGPYGFRDAGGPRTLPGFGTPDAAPAAPAAGEPAPAAGDAGSGGHSRSNVQEPGVDEADLMKTDGEIVVAIARGRVQIVSLGDRSLSASLDVGFASTALFLVGRTVAVIGAPAQAQDGRFETPVALVDVSDPKAPALQSTTWIEGVVRSSRLQSGVVRLVVADSPDFMWAYPTDGSPGAAEAAEAENRRLVESSELDEWLPDHRRVDAAGNVVATGTAASCRSTYTPSEESGLDTTTVVTLDPATGALHPGTGIAATPMVVYASERSLYVVSTTCCPDSPGDVHADVHRFDLSAPTAAPYRSSGSVRGLPVDQFALSERDGHLRVATTYFPDDRASSGAPSDAPIDTDSAVWVLGERGADLSMVGSVTGLGEEGEQIHSVRYEGRFAYVVTFRRTDPLYVVDLGDAASPVVVGEVHVPGFSTFLQHLGGDRLMGVGRGADESTGQAQGLQLSLFDVSRPASPSRAAVLSYDRGSSAAEYDHLAFLHWAEEDLVVVPLIEGPDAECRTFGGALMLEVGARSLSEVARISHGHHSGFEDPEEVVLPIHRAAVAGGSLLTLSDTGLAFGDLDDGAEQHFVTFEGRPADHWAFGCEREPSDPDREPPPGSEEEEEPRFPLPV